MYGYFHIYTDIFEISVYILADTRAACILRYIYIVYSIYIVCRCNAAVNDGPHLFNY